MAHIQQPSDKPTTSARVADGRVEGGKKPAWQLYNCVCMQRTTRQKLWPVGITGQTQVSWICLQLRNSILRATWPDSRNSRSRHYILPMSDAKRATIDCCTQMLTSRGSKSKRHTQESSITNASLLQSLFEESARERGLRSWMSRQVRRD